MPYTLLRNHHLLYYVHKYFRLSVYRHYMLLKIEAPNALTADALCLTVDEAHCGQTATHRLLDIRQNFEF
jgi:hypothetical protein